MSEVHFTTEQVGYLIAAIAGGGVFGGGGMFGLSKFTKNGKTNGDTKLVQSMDKLTEHMVEFTTGVEHDHSAQIDALKSQGKALEEQGRTLAVLCDRIHRNGG